MESWEGYNYYTANPEGWVKLMNLSTSEWNIGYFPPNVVAIPGRLNSSYSFSSDKFVIEGASRAEYGNRDIEQVIFGATSGLVLAWAIGWLAYQIKKGVLLAPRSSTSRQNDDNENDVSLQHSYNFMTAAAFEDQLDIFYNSEESELELYKRDIAQDGVSPEDVEAATELLRKRFGKDFQLFGAQRATEYKDEDRTTWMNQSDALLAEVVGIVQGWNGRTATSRAGWSREEQQELNEIVKILAEVPPTRYPKGR